MAEGESRTSEINTIRNNVVFYYIHMQITLQIKVTMRPEEVE